MNPFSHTGLSISDSLKSVRKSVLIYETIIVISDADRLYKKYDNSRFAKDLILAELTEFERISKEEKT